MRRHHAARLPGHRHSDHVGPSRYAVGRSSQASAGRYRLASRRNHRSRQGELYRTHSTAWRRRPRRGPVSPAWASGQRPGADSICQNQSPSSRPHFLRREQRGGGCGQAGRPRANPCAPAEAHGRHADVAGWGVVAGDRPTPASPPCFDDGDLRQGRPRDLADDRPPLAGRRSMNVLRQALADYLAVRRALGYRLARAEKLLAQFLAFVEDRGEEHLTIETALAWATAPAGADPNWMSRRLSDVRRFAIHLRGIDPATQVPPADILPGRSRRATPYLYSTEEISTLMAVTATLRGSHRKATYRTLIGSLAATGMRVGEAIGLDRDDFDAICGALTIRNGKFGKSRELPLHPSTIAALGDYLRRPDRPRQSPNVPALFLSPTGARLLYTNVQNTFQRLVRHAGIMPASCRVRRHAGRGYTIFDTALRSTPSSTPIATAMIQVRDWRSCRPISATSTRFTHIGISRPRRSC